MSYNFDEIVDRRNTGSIKYDFATERGMPEDILPLWVADMDFKTPQPVADALVKASAHGIYGYSDVKSDYFDTLHTWYSSRFGWEPEASWLVKTPGVVYAIATAVRGLTEKGDAVLIQRPVYYPFTRCIEVNERQLVNSPLVYSDGRYTIDFEDFEQKIIDNDVRLFILCSPHNPVGRVWTKDELRRMGDICLAHHVTIVSDEIHADFVYEGQTHTIFASIKPEFADISLTCTAPSKTFNLAGLQASNIFIPNRTLRHAFKAEMERSGFSQVGLMGLVACQAAYAHGAEWLEALKRYLTANLAFIRDFLRENLPQVKLVEPEGTYLVWLDFKALGLSEDALEDLMVNKARLWLDRGAMFGPEGEGFERFNIACPKATLEKAFSRLEAAINTL
ncbi:MalY/PatB family protein [Eubacterium sp. 1001713B170207_170306_E7]|uniref:MalY/PatB family protein n=1 Tax=Eubacterium sp. 1001713B170207_170306_E7 TaxID=2787097 RepID=UPI0018978970|nr:MalY/PatB family protein [Eubacterium sp. 1001713B170207_170306_E7]